MHELLMRRIYDKELPEGYRILIDRVWPRGMSKVRANLDIWAKEIAPTAELRKWFNHDPEKFGEFKEKYLAELNANENTDKFIENVKIALKDQDVLILYGAKDQENNNAKVLIQFLKKKIK
ncbi:DUF488 domain-containing protein [Companilactobacillus baiquanensis]|uniref:DUF488 domain-containing protein n=1 Tax=Companilactobacillus baiquanensis TaxID=2486005 RepID=A0ABW1UW13_9LACO|nr:DUF488 family protein [Companilactobacillus baiquanensis]